MPPRAHVPDAQLLPGRVDHDRLPEDQSGLRVLLAGGYERPEPGARFAADRFTDFIQKPYELADIAARLRELLERFPA